MQGLMMTRKRRTPDEAREAILSAAQGLLEREGVGALKVTRVADVVGVSHPTVLHHFGGADGLMSALHQRISRQLRDDVLQLLAGERTEEALGDALAGLASPSRGRLVAWLVASGGSVFPPAEERGLAHVLEGILADGTVTPERQAWATHAVLLGVLAMVGDSMVGDAVRERLGVDASAAAREEFRQWLLRVLMGGAPGRAPDAG